MAFFVGKNGSSDGIDAFVTAVLNAGFGTGGEAAEVDVLQRIFQVRFLHPPAAQKSQQLPQPCMSFCIAQFVRLRGSSVCEASVLVSCEEQHDCFTGPASEGGCTVGLGRQGGGVGCPV